MGFIPLELGDTVKLKDKLHYFKIEDIRFLQYIKDSRCDFELLLSCDGCVMENWTDLKDIEKRIVN